jgi:phosphoenolpyruvate carboxylase
MSTQHPDNVTTPFFAENEILGGEDEIKEAFYVFSHLNCREQLWDCEGKEVDSFVVKKLLTRYESFFSRNKLGKDFFITLRVPNPAVEKNEGKILLETLESVPRSFDIAKIFYGDDAPPIFEVFVPMTSDSRQLIRISQYYKRFVTGKQKIRLVKNDMCISEWIGEFKPESIKVSPLVENRESMFNADKIIEDYIKHERVDEPQRVWLARSDPALNYSSTATVLMEKIALQRLYNLQERLSLEILPIMGCGSTPFRGNFKPINVENCLEGYPSVQTFTIQSAFKYDYHVESVVKAIEKINNTKRKKPIQVDEEKCMKIINKLSKEYAKQIRFLAPLINKVSAHIPQRRKRKLHIGLFGYSRSVGGISLPRAITFCASLYSIGLPPEALGMNVLTEREIDYIKDLYRHFEEDMRDSFHYFNEYVFKILPNVLSRKIGKSLKLVEFETNQKHKEITTDIIKDLKKREYANMKEKITEAAWIRGFLG